jgi:Mlc titration factor MtfA (ptsG expression regulator)
MLNWWRRLTGRRVAGRLIPDALWSDTLAQYSFLAALSLEQRTALRQLSSEFLADKEFSGAQGLQVTDAMAVAIAAQACLPVLHLGLSWYDDFKGIVVHPGAMLARREVVDDLGVVHRYREEITGEAMAGGPVTLSWQDVASADGLAGEGYNVVIHEFAHKIDMRDGLADGCPRLASRAAYAHWQTVMQSAYERFRAQVVMADRFGAEPPWLDAYAATDPGEFFAVACEAYFVNRSRLTQDFGELVGLFDQFFVRPEQTSAL